MKRKILVPVDLSDHSVTVLNAAKAIAGVKDEIVLLHVVLDPSRFAGFHVPHLSTETTREELMEDARKKLDRFCSRYGSSGGACLLEFGIHFRVILNVAGREQVNLIVIGKRQGSGAMEHLFVPGTLKHVLLGAECDVKTVPLPVESVEDLQKRARL